MSKPKHDIKQFHWVALKEAVVTKFGRKINSSRQIEELCQQISKHTDENLSFTTLYRLFSAPNNQNIPYLNTLDILSNYIGFANWDRFCENNEVKNSFDKGTTVIPDKMGLQLLQICLQNHDFKSVIDYMKILPEPWVVDYQTQIAISEILGTQLRLNHNFKIHLLEELAQIPQGRHFFFETFVDLDNLQQYARETLNIYEKYVPRLSSRKFLNDFLFINCIRFLAAYRSMDIKNFKKIGYSLFDKINENDLYQDGDLHFFPIARWYSYRLIYWHFCQKLDEKIICKTIDRINVLANKNCAVAIRMFYGSLFEALTIIKFTEPISELFLSNIKLVEKGLVEEEGLIEYYYFGNKAINKEATDSNIFNVKFNGSIQSLVRCEKLYELRSSYIKF